MPTRKTCYPRRRQVREELVDNIWNLFAVVSEIPNRAFQHTGDIVPPARITARASSTTSVKVGEGLRSWYCSSTVFSPLNPGVRVKVTRPSAERHQSLMSEQGPIVLCTIICSGKRDHKVLHCMKRWNRALVVPLATGICIGDIKGWSGCLMRTYQPPSQLVYQSIRRSSERPTGGRRWTPMLLRDSNNSVHLTALQITLDLQQVHSSDFLSHPFHQFSHRHDFRLFWRSFSSFPFPVVLPFPNIFLKRIQEYNKSFKMKHIHGRKSSAESGHVWAHLYQGSGNCRVGETGGGER